ncbi:MAG TPA: DUF2721 domain-containing protein [Roseiarcus sp.]|nr:DUF2721 domain-containing protein [Roseiarcus sp.]
MNFVPNPEELAHVFSLATGPAFFLGAVTAMLAIVLGRLKAVLERIEDVDECDAPRNVDSSIKSEILVLRKRTETLGKCIYLLLSGGVCVLALLAYMTLGAVFKIEKLYGAGPLFLAANFLVAASLFMFAMDVRMEMSRNLRLVKRKAPVDRLTSSKQAKGPANLVCGAKR